MVEPVIGAERPISAGPAAASCGAPPLVMSTRCTAEPTELLTELRDIYDLGATNTQLYAATIDGISRAAREGGTQEVFKEGNTVRLLVDEERVFWSDGSLGLNVLGQDGQSSVFLPANGAIDGVSQDADSIFAIADGYLWRVSKATQEATALVDGVHGGPPLHWSETAVDDEFVYFVSYETELSLERIRKDGTDRQVLASGLADAMQPLFLLVDDTHVYAATYYGGLLMRVPLAGGMPETLAWQHQTQWPDPVLAQDDECLYYADGATLYCLSKADCTTEILLTVGEGVITQLAKSGDDLYVGVYVDSPAVKPLSWVGAVQCPMGG